MGICTRLSRRVDDYKPPTGIDGPWPRTGDEMTNAKNPPDKKLLGFPESQESVETKLFSWIRGVVLSNDQLVGALERLRGSYKLLQTGKSVPDAAEILWAVEVALSDAEKSRSALALKSLRRPGGA
jgi:hypothetical protein